MRTHACSLLLTLLGATACNIGGGGGGGPTEPPLPPRAAAPLNVSTDPVVRGALVYQRQGCRLCHGDSGNGGVANPNCETAGKINGLAMVKEGYSATELVQKIREGQQEVGKDDKQGPTPPLRMPVYGALLSDGELSDLAAYLFSLYPKGAQAAQDDWDKDDSKGAKDDKDKADDEDDSDEAADAKAPAPKKQASRDGGAAKGGAK